MTTEADGAETSNEHAEITGDDTAVLAAHRHRRRKAKGADTKTDIFIRTHHPRLGRPAPLNCFIALIKTRYKRAFCTFISMHVLLRRPIDFFFIYIFIISFSEHFHAFSRECYHICRMFCFFFPLCKVEYSKLQLLCVG